MIAFDAAITGGNTNPGTSLTWSHTCAGNAKLLVVFYRGGNSEGDRVSGATYAGVAMTKFASTANTGGGANQTIGGFFIINPAAGANNVVISLASGYLEAASSSYKAVRTTAAPDSINTNADDAASSLGVNATTVKDKCWTMLGAIGSSLTAGTGSTVRVTNNNIGIFDSNADITPAGVYNMTVESSVADMACIIVSFAPSLGTNLNTTSKMW